MKRAKAIFQFLTGKAGDFRKDHAPQLVMRYPHPEPPALCALEEGYHLRSYCKGDEEEWVNLLNANGELGKWSMDRIDAEIRGNLVHSAQFFIFSGRNIVAAAGVYEGRLNGENCWEIGWVASDPEHRGKGLGRQATAAAVVAARSLPDRPIFLRTDDFRMAAIKVYLQLGFVPDFAHPSYKRRWQDIYVRLGDGDLAGPGGPISAQKGRSAT